MPLKLVVALTRSRTPPRKHRLNSGLSRAGQDLFQLIVRWLIRAGPVDTLVAVDEAQKVAQLETWSGGLGGTPTSPLREPEDNSCVSGVSDKNPALPHEAVGNKAGISMSLGPPADPVRYTPGIEAREPDEVATSVATVEALRGISQTTFNHSGQASRSVHAKSHGVVKGTLHVAAGLPPVLAQGLFSETKSYPVTLRFSTVPGDILDDKVSTPRGLAIKVRAENNQRFPESDGDGAQDFLMVNGPAFSASTAKKFLGSLKLLAATTDRVPTLKRIASAALRATETVIEAFGGKSPAIVGLGGHPLSNILGETFFAQVPFRYGPYIAKFCCVPTSSELVRLKNVAVDMTGKPNALREAVSQHFAKNSGAWELRAQLCTGLKSMPIEDSTVVWPVEQSPFITVARIVVPVQSAGILEAGASVDILSFSPWNALRAHRPLGSINRVRKAAYEMSAQFRKDHAVCPVRVEQVRDQDARTSASSRG